MVRTVALALAVTTLGACAERPFVTDLRTPRGVVEAYFGAWNEADFSAVDTLLAADAVHEDVAQGVRAIGPEEVKVFMASSRSVMPDLHLRLTGIFADDFAVAAEWTLTATLTIPGGPAAASGTPIETRGVSIAQVEAGRIVRFTDYYSEGSSPAPAESRVR